MKVAFGELQSLERVCKSNSHTRSEDDDVTLSWGFGWSLWPGVQSRVGDQWESRELL